MIRFKSLSRFVDFAIFVCAIVGGFAIAGEPIRVTSPDGKIVAEALSDAGALKYRVLADGRELLAPSDIGLVTSVLDTRKDVALGASESKSIDEKYPFWGAKSLAINRANVASIQAVCKGMKFMVDVHVADDGVGIRCRIPAAPKQQVREDVSSWNLTGNPAMWVDAGTHCYENSYFATSLNDLKTSLSYGMPLTAASGKYYLVITEAALKDYGDLGLKPGTNHELRGYLCADAKGWTTDDAVTQPWRVTVIGRSLTDVVNSTLVQDLNPPPAPELAKADWIRPGRSSWQWLSAGEPKLSEQRQWVDWTRELGFEYYLVDDGWKKWKKDGQDAWAHLAEVCKYAAGKNVKVWLWVHSREVFEPAARMDYFKKAEAIGIVGVKIDFPPATNRVWANWYHDTARDAAACKLMVDFHGATKPTGMERTWPNEMTREGIRGHEWQMTRYKRALDPAHDTILPFTRLAAGHGDYTPTVFEKKELAGNSWAHELAQAILLGSPFLCYGGHPKSFLENPARDVLVSIPSTWDETLVLPGTEPGKCAAMARRKGTDWFVAAINAREPMELTIPLQALGKGPWKAVLLRDGQTLDSYSREEPVLKNTDSIQVKMNPQGGFVGVLRSGENK